MWLKALLAGHAGMRQFPPVFKPEITKSNTQYGAMLYTVVSEHSDMLALVDH